MQADPPLCRKPFDAPHLVYVDHCHKTGAVRGLLCPSCNSVLGMFNDDTALFARAIDYLEMSA